MRPRIPETTPENPAMKATPAAVFIHRRSETSIVCRTDSRRRARPAVRKVRAPEIFIGVTDETQLVRAAEPMIHPNTTVAESAITSHELAMDTERHTDGARPSRVVSLSLRLFNSSPP